MYVDLSRNHRKLVLLVEFWTSFFLWSRIDKWKKTNGYVTVCLYQNLAGFKVQEDPKCKYNPTHPVFTICRYMEPNK